MREIGVKGLRDGNFDIMAEAIAVVRVIDGVSSNVTVRGGEDQGEVVVVDASKSRSFSADLVFAAGDDQASVAEAVIAAVDVRSLLAEGCNLAVITYGPRDSGKSSLLFSESGGLLAGLISELIAATGKLTITGSEIVYVEKASAEVWVDLLNPENETPVKARVGAVVETEEEAWEVVRIAQKHASSWRSSPGSSSPQLQNTRGHTLLTLTCSSVRFSLLDLAGFQSSHPSPPLQGKLPADQQLMFTRMGLLQLRSFIRNVAEGRSVEANHRFKVVTAAESVMRGAKVVFAVCLRADCAPSDAINALELMETVKLLSADEVQSGEEVAEIVKSFAEIAE